MPAMDEAGWGRGPGWDPIKRFDSKEISGDRAAGSSHRSGQLKANSTICAVSSARQSAAAPRGPARTSADSFSSGSRRRATAAYVRAGGSPCGRASGPSSGARRAEPSFSPSIDLGR